MGRQTPSFRRIFQQTILTLQKKNGFYHKLKEPGHQRAFIGLVRAMSSEYAAMWNSGIFCVEDIMNLMMNIHVRACINEVEQHITQLERDLEPYLQEATIEQEAATMDPEYAPTYRFESIIDTTLLRYMDEDP
ncbi:MAG: hypothetical protein NWE83_10350 [Candidatus Bathyarchaeota archaeon]|nr:hypothetical protein [Candidatus Bathyarchaeota archaeon]